MSETRVKQKTVQSKIRFPTKEYSRDEFYSSFDDLRYMVKVRLVNGKQAQDIPVDIEDLIEFLGDIEIIIDQEDDISTEFRNHTQWTAKIRAECDNMKDINWRELENKIDRISREHGLALKKTVGLSGRGYDTRSMRITSVDYTFGTYENNDEYWINNEHNPRSYTEWVGGEIGKKDHLQEKSIHISHIETKQVTFIDKLKDNLLNILPF